MGKTAGKGLLGGSVVTGTKRERQSRSPAKPGDGPGSAKVPIFEHVEISGRTLRLPSPRREVLIFIRRVREMLEASDVSAERVRATVFGPENPILARHPTLPGAYPDSSSVREPAYWVCVDLVLRAEAREAGTSLEEAGRPFTTTMAQAARELNRVQSAIVNAVSNRTLHSWVRQGRQYLLPAEVAAYSVPRRGRAPKNKRA